MNRKQKKARLKKLNLLRKENLLKKRVRILLGLSHLFVFKKIMIRDAPQSVKERIFYNF